MKPAERIKKIMDDKGLDQGQMATALGISQGYLSQVQIGIREPSREFLKKMNLVYGISSDYILYGDEKETGYKKVKEPPLVYERRLPQNAPNRKIIDKVLKILDSGNDTVIRALKSNLEAFLLVTKTEDKAEGD